MKRYGKHVLPITFEKVVFFFLSSNCFTAILIIYGLCQWI